MKTPLILCMTAESMDWSSVALTNGDFLDWSWMDFLNNDSVDETSTEGEHDEA